MTRDELQRNGFDIYGWPRRLAKEVRVRDEYEQVEGEARWAVANAREALLEQLGKHQGGVGEGFFFEPSPDAVSTLAAGMLMAKATREYRS